MLSLKLVLHCFKLPISKIPRNIFRVDCHREYVYIKSLLKKNIGRSSFLEVAFFWENVSAPNGIEGHWTLQGQNYPIHVVLVPWVPNVSSFRSTFAHFSDNWGVWYPSIVQSWWIWSVRDKSMKIENPKFQNTTRILWGTMRRYISGEVWKQIEGKYNGLECSLP